VLIRICERCQAEVPRPHVLCRCGGRIKVVDYHPKGEGGVEPRATDQMNWQDVGKFVGAKVTGGNPLGAFVGGLLGRILEGDAITTKVVVEPPVINVTGIDRKALYPIGKRIAKTVSKTASRAITVGGRPKREKKSKKDVR
jgi:hypothetical protein